MTESTPKPVADVPPDVLISERRGTHGRWAKQSATEQRLKIELRAGEAWASMSSAQRSAVEMIAVKLSRIVNGDPGYADHWADIAGYARLGELGDHAPATTDCPIESWVGNTH